MHAKMLKKLKPEETIVFFMTFLSLVAFQLGVSSPLKCSPGYAYEYQRAYFAFEFRRKYVCDN